MEQTDPAEAEGKSEAWLVTGRMAGETGSRDGAGLGGTAGSKG